MREYEKEIELDLSKLYEPNYLNSRLYKLARAGWHDFVLRAPEEGSAYPNTCAPVAGVIDYYRSKGYEVTCDWVDRPDSYIGHTRLENPFIVESKEGARRLARPFDVVWRFADSSDIKKLVDATRDHVLESCEVEEGVLTGIEWCLYEIMDNVLQHSDASCGFYMGQFTNSNKKLSLCVFDNGRGIYNSLKSSKKHSPRTALDAITLALQERVTRDESIGQGNGMWGFSEIVRLNGGSYSVSSNGAKVFFDKEESHPNERGGFYYGLDNLGTTLVDFQLDCSHRVDVAQALKQDPTRLWLEDMEDPAGEEYVLSIASESAGTGTRQAAERVRHKASNIIREGDKLLVLDFENVNLVSSSYADELIGKLVAEIGFSVFNSYCQLRNLSILNQQVVDRSVQQRMAQEYYNEPPMEDEDD